MKTKIFSLVRGYENVHRNNLPNSIDPQLEFKTRGIYRIFQNSFAFGVCSLDEQKNRPPGQRSTGDLLLFYKDTFP